MELQKELILLIFSVLFIQQVQLKPPAGLTSMIPNHREELESVVKSDANTALTWIENLRKKISKDGNPVESVTIDAIGDPVEEQTEENENIREISNSTGEEDGIGQILRSLADEIDVATRKRDLQRQFNRMNAYFAEFLHLWTIVSDLNFRREISGDACKFAKKYYGMIPGIFTEIEHILVPSISISRNTLDLLTEDVAKNSAHICAAGSSPLDYFYDLYNTTITTGVKGFFILKFSHFILTKNDGMTDCEFGSSNATRQLTLFENSIKSGLEKCTKEFVRMMNQQKNMTEFRACDQHHDPEKIPEAIQVDDFILKIIFEIISSRKDLFIFLLL